MNKIVLIRHPNKNRRTISFNRALSEDNFYCSFIGPTEEGVPEKALEIREKLLKVNLVNEVSIGRYNANFGIQEGFEEDPEECHRIEREALDVVASVVFPDEPRDIRFTERTWANSH